MRKKSREKERQGPARNLAAGAQGHTIQQDRKLSIRGKTKIISQGCLLKGEVLQGEVLKGCVRHASGKYDLVD